ncbi:amino acid adenylation domain-containing protein [Micromonospora sp. NPDC000089]|uniref:amino acid adenylation domain-containing protein n=1 Tax=unclassified Micromonospora TaxID=2617518 RepID=UPI0036B5C3CF
MAIYELPTSFAQRRMWLLVEMDPDLPTYNISWAVWLDGPLDVDALQGAWDAALARHEALRTTFRHEAGVPVQIVDDEPDPRPLLITSVEHRPDAERVPAAQALIRDMAGITFDVADGPLAVATLVRMSPEAHVLAVVAHHIVADGWSFRVLFDELSTDYEAMLRDGAPTVAEPAIQYADYAIWQLGHAEDGGYAPAGRFWQDELAEAPSALSLPNDEPYPARQTFAGRSIHTTLDNGLADALRQLAARQGSTVFAVLLAAYAVVLSRLTDSDDLVIAVPMAARTRPETETMVGLLMNTVPIRVRIDRDATLGDLVRSVHRATVRALAHQELPFERMVELLRPDRDPARFTLTQVMFAMEESWAVPDRGGLHWRPELVENGTAKFEIELTVTEAADGPRVRVSYNSDLFHDATGQLVTDGFRAILRRLADDPDGVVADAEIMSPDLSALVTDRWPDGGPHLDPGATAVARLHAACDGDAVVVTGGDGELTGAQVRDRARRIAAALADRGVGAADRVGILLPRGARLLPTVLGVWSTGAAYIPLDPIYPEQRIAMMLADAGAAAIVVDSGVAVAPALPPAAASIPVVDLAALPADLEQPDPVLDGPPSAPAVTIFTSGSTGRPKAVTVTQGGIAALLDAVVPMLALGPRDRFVAVSTFAFDIALVELLAPVLAGGRVAVADTDQVKDPARLRDLLIDSGATAMQATPAGWRMLVDADGIPETVTLRMTAGEPLPRDLADVMGAGRGARVWNLYGPTETTIYSGGDLVAGSPAPIEIGSIIAGTRLYVLDSRQRPVPPGVFGEVYIAGAGVAHGYHGSPGMTAARFRPDPFTGRPGARLYRTGDVGRWRRTGRIELAGRADRQIKIRGYRIESGEVEVALRSHPDVAEAVVSVRGGRDDVRLVGYIVTANGADRPPAGLSEHLRRTLPDYMVPAAYVVLPELPLTRSGKVDHRKLPEPDWSASSSQESVAPRTPVEARLAAVVAELLLLPAPVGVRDNFFALGGHSLTAARLMARIRADYGIDLPIRTLFADPTVAGLAATMAAGGPG